ncbi:MAG: hypothetical protein N4A65_03460 [Cohaesibacter sp.]|nr:hypothetical protein [Cohaesibacter sp.]
MIRTLYVLLAALFTAAIIHIVTIFLVPSMAVQGIWQRSAKAAPEGSIHIMSSAQQALSTFPELDPAFAYAFCRMDISQAPARLSGSVDSSFWSLAYIDEKDRIQYSLTNQISGSDLQVVLANRVQQRQLSDRQDLVDDTAVIITATGNKGLLFLRAFVGQESKREHLIASLKALDCQPLWDTLEN